MTYNLFKTFSVELVNGYNLEESDFRVVLNIEKFDLLNSMVSLCLVKQKRRLTDDEISFLSFRYEFFSKYNLDMKNKSDEILGRYFILEKLGSKCTLKKLVEGICKDEIRLPMVFVYKDSIWQPYFSNVVAFRRSH